MQLTSTEDPPLWTRGDVLTALAAGLAAFVLYAATVAPNVTLLDSGEFITAAQHFGVPHPTGYPLWTFTAWVFQLLFPFGNAAWKINLWSSVCGALAVGVSALLGRSSLRWLLGGELEKMAGLATIITLTSALLLSASVSMWSQSVITEVYALHALMVALSLVALYVWVRNPERLAPLMACFFLLALAFSNHHLTLALVPLPVLAVLLLRRDLVWELVIAGLMTSLLAYLGFAILSGDGPVLKTAIRFFYLVMLGLVVLVITRRFQVEWRLIAYLPFVVALGLLPYAYMPLASSTNPPMNWSYTRAPEGFYYAFNRSQYGGTLADLSLESLGRVVGTFRADHQKPSLEPVAAKQSLLSSLQEWTGFFWIQLSRSFTPLFIIAYFLAFLVIFRLEDLRRRTWVYVLEIAFVLAAILQPAVEGADTDKNGWWLQMPYHTYTNLLFSLLAALGVAVMFVWISYRAPRLAWLRYLLLLLPIVPLFANYGDCSQRDRWFGWQFGHDILKDLPPGSVFYGGTDPGRFVPTYMIMGESSQPGSVKRDPSFDRRDLFVITQNGVGEPLYRRYIADHYGKSRPTAHTTFEHWLGRDAQYPATTLDLPSEADIEKAAREGAEKDPEAAAKPTYLHDLVSRLIWERNRDRHRFFVEESFPMEWSYDHALPHGLVYEISKEPLKELPPGSVAADMQFWRGYVSKLLADPAFADDYDAQRSFSKLRSTTGGLYKHRKMMREAETAYREALLLWPGNPDALNAMSSMLWDRGDNDGVVALFRTATDADPNCIDLWRIRLMAEKRKELASELGDLEKAVAAAPSDKEATAKLLDTYIQLDDTNKLSNAILAAVPHFTTNEDFLVSLTQCSDLHHLPKVFLSSARQLATNFPNTPDNQLLLARAATRNNDKATFVAAAQAALKAGGLPTREILRKSPEFEQWRQDNDVRAILGLHPMRDATNAPAPSER